MPLGLLVLCEVTPGLADFVASRRFRNRASRESLLQIGLGGLQRLDYRHANSEAALQAFRPGDRQHIADQKIDVCLRISLGLNRAVALSFDINLGQTYGFLLFPNQPCAAWLGR